MFVLLIFIIIIIVIIVFIKRPHSNFNNIPTIAEQKKRNNTFLKEYKDYKKKEEKREVPLTNANDALESMECNPALKDRLTCFSAPAWWYPEKRYDANNFRSIFYGDYYDPAFNYLGNAQEMYWDFKTVRDTYDII
jgi:hypothetical protein